VIFVDTGAFLARYMERDQHHEAATACWNELSQSNVACFTSNLVLGETLTLLARRTSGSFAAERARQLYSSTALEILRPNSADEAQAVILFDTFSGQRVSFCDCISFALMRGRGLTEAFTFDQHFALAGFNIRP
jgi:predicted nucleic acid-binding protein